MTNDALDGFGPSPPQASVLELVAARADAARDTGKGRIVCLAGEAGSGKSHLLRLMHSRLAASGDLRVVTGGLADPPSDGLDSELRERAEALISSGASAAAALDPAFALVGPVAGISVAAAGLLRALGTTSKLERAELVTRVLRAAAAEAPAQPLICLVDDGDWLSSAWWTELQFGFGREAVEDLGAVLLFCLDGPPQLDPNPSDQESSPRRVARSLVARDLADWCPLEPLTASATTEWLGAFPSELGTAALELSGGRTGDLAELLGSWIDAGTVTRSEEDGWRLHDGDALVADARRDLVKRIESMLPGRDRGEDEMIREALACGALEGMTFTACAVADAIEAEREAVEDLFDSLVDETETGDGVLLGPRTVQVHDLDRQSARAVWRYRFASRLLWRAAARLDDADRQAVVAADLIEALEEAYDHETPAVAAVLERLARVAGQPALAGKYRSMMRGISRSALRAQAHFLLVADRTGWSQLDHRDAAYAFSQASDELQSVSSSSSLLAFVEHAKEHGARAGAVGGRALAFALDSEGQLRLRLGEVDLAEERLEQAAEMLAEGDPEGRAAVLRHLSDAIVTRHEDLGAARGVIEEAQALFARSRNRLGEAACKYDLAGIELGAGNYAVARTLAEEALEAGRSQRSPEEEMAALHLLADIERHDGRKDLARELVETVLRFAAAEGHTHNEAASLRLLGAIELDRGEAESAWKAASAGLTMHRRLEDRQGEAVALCTMAEASLELDERERARRLFLEARALFEQLGNTGQTRYIDGELDSFS